MTLHQYLSQKNPARMLSVIIKDKELSVASVYISARGEISSRVYINTDNPLLAGVEYRLIGTYLHAVDRDGNAKGRSCFRINDESKYNSYNPKFNNN